LRLRSLRCGAGGVGEVGYSSCGDAALTPPGDGKLSKATAGSSCDAPWGHGLTGGTGAAPIVGWQPACGQAGAPPQAPQEEHPTSPAPPSTPPLRSLRLHAVDVGSDRIRSDQIRSDRIAPPRRLGVLAFNQNELGRFGRSAAEAFQIQLGDTRGVDAQHARVLGHEAAHVDRGRHVGELLLFD